MNAQAGQVVAFTSRQLLGRDAAAIVSTLAAVAAWGYAVATLAAQPEPHDAALERAMFASCKLPDTEGGATLFLRFLGKGFCWRFQ